MNSHKNKTTVAMHALYIAFMDQQIDAYITSSRLLNGQEIKERAPWNTQASADAIRHFAYGISDANPLWIDPAYAAQSHYKSLVAPPTFYRFGTLSRFTRSAAVQSDQRTRMRMVSADS